MWKMASKCLPILMSFSLLSFTKLGLEELQDTKIMSDEYLEKLGRTELAKQLKQIRSVYEKLEKQQERFCERFCIQCKSGCGSCCEHFTPDLSELESDYLAYGIVSQGYEDHVLEVLDKVGEGNIQCPLYDKENEAHHCTVYYWRPLICRLFGAAASRDKEGHAVFRNCKWNEDTHEVTTKELESHKRDLVVMGDVGMKLLGQNPDDQEPVLLPEILRKSIYKVKLMLKYEQESKKKPDA